ncbi:hypothetical protein A3K63_04665 [Candidatus Micrarchaeota archaeon RBG_16_49_10]|nr:MAG: hypothetical protein A3K63_04665 [Candidatus Micrarchaeota archaeon RBG_16_49_10]
MAEGDGSPTLSELRRRLYELNFELQRETPETSSQPHRPYNETEVRKDLMSADGIPKIYDKRRQAGSIEYVGRFISTAARAYNLLEPKEIESLDEALHVLYNLQFQDGVDSSVMDLYAQRVVRYSEKAVERSREHVPAYLNGKEDKPLAKKPLPIIISIASSLSLLYLATNHSMKAHLVSIDGLSVSALYITLALVFVGSLMLILRKKPVKK